MVNRQDLMKAGAMVLGAGAGAAAAKYGSNLISEALTKKDREISGGNPKTAPKDVQVWKKAYLYDMLFGGAALALSLYGGRTIKGNVAVGVGSAGAYLLANGLTDWIGDVMAEEANKTYNGRPLRVTKEDGAAFKNQMGALSRVMATGCGARVAAQRVVGQRLSETAGQPVALM